MTEDQAQVMIDLLIEISAKLTDLSDKVAHENEYKTISEKLGEIESNLSDIKYNTSN